MTIAIDGQLLRTARVKAVQQGTSVNEICRQAIEQFARGADDASSRLSRLQALSRKAKAGTAKAWPGRELLYAESGRV